MPLVHWGEGMPAVPGDRPRALTTAAVPPQVYMGPRDLWDVARAREDVTHPARANAVTQDALGVLLHELAHTQQVNRFRQMAQPGARFPIEGGAEAFGQLAQPAVARRLGMRPLPYRPGYGNLGQQFLNRYGPRQALYGQFGR
jgi:hypothetical protein